MAKEGLGLSETSLTGGHGSAESFKEDRLFLMMKRVLIRHPNATLLNTVMVAEYAVNPINRLSILVLERRPAIAVDDITSNDVGANNIQCFLPKDTELAMRTWRRVIAATKSKHVCRIVTTSQRRMAEPGSEAMPTPEGPLVDSLIICQTKRERAIRSRPASQRWLLSAGERERKVGSPNSAYNGEDEPVILLAKNRTYG